LETLALILAGGKGTRLDILSEKRSKPAMPFAGKFRIIDFCLSNCAQSKIYDIAILTQYLPLSLNEHIGSGKPWDLDRRDSSITLLQPHNYWYNGTADAVLKNLEFVERKKPKYVLILSGDHIYKMNYQNMIKVHKDSNAKMTIAVQKVDINEASRFGILSVDKDGYVSEFEEKPKNPKSDIASMGIYLFDFDVLKSSLLECKNDNLDFGHHVIPYLLKKYQGEIATYRFDDYWQDVGTYDSYLETNLELTKDSITLDLYDPNFKVYTRSEEFPPVKIGTGSVIHNSLISNGCIIYGQVINSVLSPGVIVKKNTIIKDSVILNGCKINENCKLEKVILDKNCVISQGATIGITGDNTPNVEKPDLLYSGITVLAKGTNIPSGVSVGKNCRIFNTSKIDINTTIDSGSTLR
jgi:glucose-1-phosphate adenylyltransferase